MWPGLLDAAKALCKEKFSVIYVLHGEDDFSQKEFLDNLRDEVGVPELLEANTSVLAGGELTLGQLRDVCSVVPFLAERRLVVVKGLLAR